LQPDEKLHTPVGVPPSGLLTSLRLLVRGLLPAITRRMEEEGERKEEEERRKSSREVWTWSRGGRCTV
jgi:hypothetical protein